MSQHFKSDVVVKVSGLTHRYGNVKALDSVNFEIPAGKKVGLIGPDGVGKSSLLALISGVRKLQSGNIRVLNGEIADDKHRGSICSQIAFMPQGLGKNLYHTLSVFENIDFFGRLFGHSREERLKKIDELLSSTGLAPFPDRPMGKLSGGMKQKLGLSCALIHDPELLILDEPTTGVDPLSRRQFWELIDHIRARKANMNVIIATAYMEEAEQFDFLMVMNEGKILATGSPDEIKSKSGTHTLEEAFIRLLPEEKRRGYKKITIPPMKKYDGITAIEAKDLTKKFGDFTAVNKVNFKIEKGEIFGFVGSNGCGKTTTMKMLTGLLPVTEGKAEIFGHTLVARDIATRKRVGYMSQSFSLYSELTVLQNLELHARLFHLPENQIKDRVDELVDRMGLDEVLNEQAEKLPLGISQRLSLAVAIIHYPELLILDEPTSGVDPIARDKFWELLIDLSRNRGVTIFISTHFMNEAERCDRISLMHDAKVLATDTPKALISKSGTNNLEETFIYYLKNASEEITDDLKNTSDIQTIAGSSESQTTKRDERKKLFDYKRLWAFTRRESMELIRDPIRLFFALIGPLLLMIVLGYGISFDVENLPYAILDRDQTPESRKYLENFSGSRYFQERPPLKNYAELDRRLKNGELRIAIELPPEYGKDLKRGNQPQIGVWLDGGFPFRTETARGYIQGLHALYLSDIKNDIQWERYDETPLNIENRFRYNQDMKSVFAIVPGIIAMLLALIPTMLTAVGVVREKELGSIINLYATPASRLEFLLGKQIPYIAIGIINFLCLFLLAIFLFGVSVKGSFLALAAGALIFVVSTTSFGLLLSAFTKTQIAALVGALLITMINSMSFSGFLQPVSSLQGGGAVIARTFPTTYFMNISRGTFTKALGFNELASNYLALILCIMVFLILSFVFLKKQET